MNRFLGTVMIAGISASANDPDNVKNIHQTALFAFKQLLKYPCLYWLTKQITLKKWAVVLFQKDTLGFRLDALGNEFDIQILGHANDGFLIT